jgi:aryl-alcohol dehydrogenase (NADP+)
MPAAPFRAAGDPIRDDPLRGSMEYVSFGRTGLKVPRLCLGMMTYGSKNYYPWLLDWDESWPIIRHALDLGFRFFDTSNVYSHGVSEEFLGRALKEYGLPREQAVITTKVFAPMGDTPNERGLSRKHMLHQIDESLRRLGTDYVDLYLIHRYDPAVPMEEVIDTMDDIVRAGKARYTGACSMFAWQFAKFLSLAEKRGKTRFVSMQNHYNLIYREEEREMLPLCRAEGIAVTPWSPFARGFLAGNRGGKKEGETLRAKTDGYGHGLYYKGEGSDYRADDYQIRDAVTKVATQRGATNAQVALAWVLQQPGITSPIIGATKTTQLDDTVKALDLKLAEDELKMLAEPYQPHAIAGHS